MYVTGLKFLFLIFLLMLSVSVSADFSGLVFRVIDGDTIIVLEGNKKRKVRLTGIDAPELKQEFGFESKQKLRSLIDKKWVDIASNSEDRYKRTLGKVICNGVDINLNLIKLGMAWHYKRFKNSQDRKDQFLYSNAEKYAKVNKLGLWSKEAPIAPWRWRKNKK